MHEEEEVYRHLEEELALAKKTFNQMMGGQIKNDKTHSCSKRVIQSKYIIKINSIKYKK